MTAQKRRFAYLFEAKGIQKFIMAGGKLVDMAGGSALIASAVRSDKKDLLAVVLKQAEFELIFSRRAGAAFMIHFGAAEMATFERFRALWRLVFSAYAPGVEFVERLAEGETDEEALKAAYKMQIGRRENGPDTLLPPSAPLAAHSPRTGQPAVERIHEEGVDLSTRHRRAAGRAGRQVPGFMSEDMAKTLCWPVHMEKPDHKGWKEEKEPLFPFVGEDRRIGLIHADISGLGQIYQNFSGTPQERLDLAKAIEKLIHEAAQKAAREVLAKEHGKNGALPARPILLGGDDLTIIVRADRALAYARVFLEALEKPEKKSAKALASLLGKTVTLSACAGIAFGRHNLPFLRLSALAEKLCSFAKKHVKAGLGTDDPIPSAIAFYRQTTSLIEEDVDEIIAHEATDAQKRRLTAQPWLVGDMSKDDLWKLCDLEALKDFLNQEEVARGRPRKLRSLLLNDPAGAQREYARWRKILDKRGMLEKYDELMEELGVTDKELPFADRQIEGLHDQHLRVSPLFDALEWLMLEGRRGRDKQQDGAPDNEEEAA